MAHITNYDQLSVLNKVSFSSQLVNLCVLNCLAEGSVNCQIKIWLVFCYYKTLRPYCPTGLLPFTFKLGLLGSGKFTDTVTTLYYDFFEKK